MEAWGIAVRKAQPEFHAVHTDTLLTTLSVAYRQADAELDRAAGAFPVVPVVKQSDKYKKYRKEDWFRAQAQKRAPASESVGSGYELSEDTYSADVWAFHKDVDDFVRGNFDNPLDPDRDATEFVTRSMILTRAKEWNTTFFKTGVWTGQADQTGVAAAPGANQFLQFNDAASNPITVVRTGRQAIKKSTGMNANTMVIEERVFDILIEHPLIVDRIKYTQRALAGDVENTDLLARVFRIPRIIVLSTIEATGPEGAATFDWMAGKHMWIGYVAPRPSILTPSAGYIFGWRLPGVPGDGSIAIDRIRMPLHKSDRIEGNMAWDMKVVAADLGAFFASAIA